MLLVKLIIFFFYLIMNPYLENKETKISLKKFKKKVPPRFITFIEKHFKIESLHIFYDKDIHFGKKYYIETNPCECYLCKKNIDFIKMNDKINSFINNNDTDLNENILYKIHKIGLEKLKLHRIFTCEGKINSEIYLEYYYHLCDTCFSESLYYWYIKNEEKYPSLREEGFRFIHKNDSFVPEIKSRETLNKIKKIDFPMKFKCNYYNNINNTYTFMDI